MKAFRSLAGVLLLSVVMSASAGDNAPPAAPLPYTAVTVTGAATASVPNDRMHASLRAETDAPSAAAGASEVNARIAAALARAKSTAGVEARTTGYSTWQVNERGKPTRWRVAQSLTLESSDFAQLAALLTALQDDGLLLSGMNFSVRSETRRAAEDALTRQAIKAWQYRAELATSALGYATWRPGRITVSAGDAMTQPQPVFRAQVAAAPPVSPVAVEAGATDITVTVSGDAIVENPLTR